MNPSEMTGDELRLAIAEELGMHVHILARGRFKYWLDIPKGKQAAPRIRNWPSDVAAALGLLDEHNDVRIDKDGDTRWTVDIYSDPLIIIGSSDAPTLARAISEAVYMALKAKEK